MPIPDYQTLMLPVLKALEDKQEYHIRQVIEKLAVQFNLTDEERKELLPSGLEGIFDNRVHWAKTYLKKAGLLDNSRRAHLKITQRGLETIKSNPAGINAAYLKKFPEFVEFQNLKRSEKPTNGTTVKESQEESKSTPEEQLADAYTSIRAQLAQDIIEKVVSLSPQFFERLVVGLLVKMGYGGSIEDAGKAVGRSGDGGIDGVIKEDRLGLDIIYLQAKRWKPGNVVGRPEIQGFVGALAGQGAKKGVFITTSSFTKEARGYEPRNETKIVLIDGEQLAQLMIDYDLGVSTQSVYHVKKLDGDFFEED